MGIFNGCLLACDVDGTLMASGYINPENIKKVERFINEGGKFVISTGRGVTALGPVIEKMKSISLAVVANGCIIYDYDNSEILYDKVLPKNDYHFAEYIANMGFDVGVEVHSGAQAYTLKRNNATTVHQIYEKFSAPDVNFEEICGLKWHKVIYLFEKAEDREKAKEKLKNAKSECAFIDTCAVIDGELQNYLEQVPFGVSKAFALERLCETLDIKKENLFAIGDYYNDLEMLKLSGICAAPEDSPEDIKQIADYITCTCKRGAVADFIAYLETIYGNR